MEFGSAWMAEAVGDPVSGLMTDMSEELPSRLAA